MWRSVLDFVFPAQCANCNAFGSGLCESCAPLKSEWVRIRLPTLNAVAYAAYEGPLRAAILALKDGRRDVAEALGERIAPLLEAKAVVVPIPTTAKRRRVRGMDGVEVIARRVASLTKSSLADVLEQRAGDAQRGRNRDERIAARGRFRCRSPMNGRNVTLLDDVCTTGSTLEDCARAIREAGGEVTGAVVVAATKSRPSWNPAS